MPRSRKPEPQFPVKLSQAQRKAIAEIAPEFAKRLKLDERNLRTIQFTLNELQTIQEKAQGALRQTGTGRKARSLGLVFDSTAEALDRHRGSPARKEGAGREGFLAELRAIASRYQWHFLAADRQREVEQIAYRIWQEEGCIHGRHEDHWQRAEKAFNADRPIRGAIVDAPKKSQAGQLLNPLQAVVHAKTGEVYPALSPGYLAEAGFPMAPDEVGAIEAAAEAAAEGYDAALRTGIARAVGLEP
jgi:hypothetical protein